MSNDRFWELMSRHLAAEATKAEEDELSALIEADHGLRLRFETITNYWGKDRRKEDLAATEAYEKIRGRLDAPAKAAPGRRVLLWTMRAAAAATVILAAFLYYGDSLTSGELWARLQWSRKENSFGQRSQVVLQDGTKVWLNASSNLTYPETFDGKTREVYLSGEAFFDVARDTGKPFIIHLEGGDIRVLGTSFNVRAFSDEPEVETSVLTGRVAFVPASSATGTDTVELTRNEKVTYDRRSRQLSKISTNSEEDRAWVDGRIIFKRSRFEDIAHELERVFGKKMTFRSDALRNCRFTATFQDNSLEDVMTLLSHTKDFEFRIAEREVIISGDGCPE